MAARFNRHVPALCAECGAPLSVRERRNIPYNFEKVCTWHAYTRLREQFEVKAPVESFWISEPSDVEVTFALPDKEPQTVVVTVDPGEMFGYVLQKDVGDDEAGKHP